LSTGAPRRRRKRRCPRASGTSRPPSAPEPPAGQLAINVAAVTAVGMTMTGPRAASGVCNTEHGTLHSGGRLDMRF